MSEVRYIKGFSATHGSIDKAYIDFELTDRKAKCKYCDMISKSNKILPFFKAEPEEVMDSYYCGCRGFN